MNLGLVVTVFVLVYAAMALGRWPGLALDLNMLCCGAFGRYPLENRLVMLTLSSSHFESKARIPR
jgi:hypothetical protein